MNSYGNLFYMIYNAFSLFRRTSQDAGTPEATPFYSFSFARNSSTRHPYL